VSSNSTFLRDHKEEKAIDFSGESVYYLQRQIMLTTVIRGGQAFPAAGCNEYFLYINMNDHV
jgi:hypothetical protein